MESEPYYSEIRYIKNPFIDEGGKRPWHKRFTLLPNNSVVWLGCLRLRINHQDTILPEYKGLGDERLLAIAIRHREQYRERLVAFSDPIQYYSADHNYCGEVWLGIARKLPANWSEPDSRWNDWFHLIHWGINSEEMTLSLPVALIEELKRKGNPNPLKTTNIFSVNPEEAFEIASDYLGTHGFDPVGLFRFLLTSRMQ